MDSQTPENRPHAPGALGVVQEFLNSANLARSPGVTPDIAEDIRLRRESGDSQASLAREYRIGQKFVNAVSRGARVVDDLGACGAAAVWLTALGLAPEGVSVSERDLDRLLELRHLLRELALANNGQVLEVGALESLASMAASVPVVLQFGAQPEIRPSGAGVEAAIGRLLVVVFDAMRDGSWARLKRCTGDGCPHTFYDASRNRTGTWCAMSVCGNRTKIRNYQQRRRASRTP